MKNNNKNMWTDKLLLLYDIVDNDDINDILENGISYTDHYLDILTKERFNSLIKNNNHGIVIVAIPDEVDKYIDDIDDDSYKNWKSQFDYENNKDNMLDEISNKYLIPKHYGDSVKNFLPSPLMYGYVIDRKVNRNPKYFDFLSDDDKLYYCDIIKKGINQDIEYEDYVLLANKKNIIQGPVLIKKNKPLT